jgi:hypothetical protein
VSAAAVQQVMKVPPSLGQQPPCSAAHPLARRKVGPAAEQAQALERARAAQLLVARAQLGGQLVVKGQAARVHLGSVALCRKGVRGGGWREGVKQGAAGTGAARASAAACARGMPHPRCCTPAATRAARTGQHHRVGAGVEYRGGHVLLQDDVHARRQAALREAAGEGG